MVRMVVYKGREQGINDDTINSPILQRKMYVSTTKVLNIELLNKFDHR